VSSHKAEYPNDFITSLIKSLRYRLLQINREWESILHSPSFKNVKNLNLRIAVTKMRVMMKLKSRYSRNHSAQNIYSGARFEVLMARMKMAVSWDVAPCGLVDTDQRFRGLLMMTDAVSSSETSVNIYQTTRCDIPEDSHLYFGLLSYF
jgi:hypothetical protein